LEDVSWVFVANYKEKPMLHDPRHDLPEWKRILLRAHEIIEERGWCQHVLQAEDGRVCLEGAVRIASGVKLFRSRTGRITHASDDAHLPAALNAIRMLQRQLLSAKGPWEWNDQPGRTKDEVLKLIRDTVADVEPIHHFNSRTQTEDVIPAKIVSLLQQLETLST
jgi:hypothetical protein